MWYVADFETNTLSKQEEKDYKEGKIKLKDLSTSVWGWGIVPLGKYEDEDITVKNSLEQFMQEIQSYPKNPKIYFHNLKFDGHFILSWLLRNNFKHVSSNRKMPERSFTTLINDDGVFYSIEVNLDKRYNRNHKIKFLDSIKKLPLSVDKIGKAFDLKHKKLDVPESFYQKYRDKDHVLTPLEIKYIKNDIRVVSMALAIIHQQGDKKMTIGSDALHDFKSRMSKKAFESLFPILETSIDDDIKKAYRGGVTMVKESVRSKEIGIGKSYDINSMYPFIMHEKLLPVGKPIFYQGRYKEDKRYNLYIQEIRCEFKLKENHLPTIQIKDKPGQYLPREFLRKSNGPTTMHLTNVDLELFLDHYEVYDLQYVCGYKFRSSDKVFREYIDYWGNVKENSTGPMRQLAKLKLNSLYGKFGTKTIVGSKKPILNEDGIVKLELDEPELIDPIYSATAVFTTSYGRDMLIRTAQSNYDRFCYCDTDSIHVSGVEKPKGMEFHSTKLGAWDDEGTFTRARFIGAKCYIEDFIEGGLKVTCAGMTKKQHEQVTFENFKEGLTVTGKLQPKVVKNGVVLINVDYQVKVRGFIF